MDYFRDFPYEDVDFPPGFSLKTERLEDDYLSAAAAETR